MNLIRILRQTRKQKGFSLIELLISFSILSLGIMAVFILMSKNVEYSRFSKDQILASQLAQEGIELLRNLKDNDTEFNDKYESGEYIIDKNKFEINTDPDIFKLYLKYEEGNKFYVHDKDDSEPSKFFRKVDLVVRNDTDGKKIIEERIMVSWNDKGLPSDPADCTLANKCLSVGSIAPDTNIVCTCTSADLVCQGDPVYYDNCEGQCGVGTKTDGECCASLVVKNQPVNITGVTLANANGIAVTNDLIFKPNLVATGGNIVYTDKDGLRPTPAPTSETVYVVHKFDDKNVVNLDSGACSITFEKPMDNVELLLVGGGGYGDFQAGAAGGFRLLNKSVTARTYNMIVGAGGANIMFAVPSDQVYHNNRNTIWDTGGSDQEVATGGGGGGSYSYVNGGSGSGGYAVQWNNGPEYVTPGTGNTPATAPSQGNNGGTSKFIGSGWMAFGAGGGGASSTGYQPFIDTSGNYNGGKGGDGISSSISGISTIYAAGGGGGTGRYNGGGPFIGGEGGSGGIGGKGHSWNSSVEPAVTTEKASGKPWTGSGGGGIDYGFSWGYDRFGGCGIIIIRYPYSEVLPTLTWGTGGAGTINADGTYTLTDSSGNKIDATLNYSGLPKTDQTDSITVECQ